MVGPLLAYGLAAPILGKTGDIYGHRRLYLFGLLGAMVSALLTALAHNVDMLLFARTLDGVQGAATGTASGALINSVFGREERVKAMGWWSLVGAGGPVIGVSLGAPIIAAFGWRALFWFQLVVDHRGVRRRVDRAAAATRHRRRGAREKKAKARREFKTMDWIGSWSLSIAVTALMLGLSIGPSVGWTSVWCVGTLRAVGRHDDRLRPPDPSRRRIPSSRPHYFRRRNFVMPMVLRASANFAYFGAFFLFPLLMEQGYGYSIPRVGALAIARPTHLRALFADRRLRGRAHRRANQRHSPARRSSRRPSCSSRCCTRARARGSSRSPSRSRGSAWASRCRRRVR